MKKIFYLMAAFAALSLVSCNKAEFENTSSKLSEMTFSVAGEGLDIAVTKAAAVTGLTSVYWGATAGTLGSDTEEYAPVSLSVSDGNVSTGNYWPAESIAYNYYVSNVAYSWDASNHKATIAASNETDIVAAVASASYKSSPKVTLEHIFARTGNLTLEPKEGYTLVGDAVWKIKSNTDAGTSGTYNIGTKAWSDVAALSQQVFTSSSDLYLVPGSYNVEITYTLKKEAFEQEYTKSANVTLGGGVVNNIKATAHTGSDDPSEITLSVEVKPWGENNITIAEGDLN